MVLESGGMNNFWTEKPEYIADGKKKWRPGNAKFQDPHPFYLFILLLISSCCRDFSTVYLSHLGLQRAFGPKCGSGVWGVYVGVDAKGGCWTLAVSAELGTRTHLALMLLGCPAVRVRGATRPHPFKASPGKRPLLKAPAQHEGGAYFFFPPFVPPPDKSAVNLWRGRSADTTLSPRVVDMETETQK